MTGVTSRYQLGCLVPSLFEVCVNQRHHLSSHQRQLLIIYRRSFVNLNLVVWWGNLSVWWSLGVVNHDADFWMKLVNPPRYVTLMPHRSRAPHPLGIQHTY